MCFFLVGPRARFLLLASRSQNKPYVKEIISSLNHEVTVTLGKEDFLSLFKKDATTTNGNHFKRTGSSRFWHSNDSYLNNVHKYLSTQLRIIFLNERNESFMTSKLDFLTTLLKVGMPLLFLLRLIA